LITIIYFILLVNMKPRIFKVKQGRFIKDEKARDS